MADKELADRLMPAQAPPPGAPSRCPKFCAEPACSDVPKASGLAARLGGRAPSASDSLRNLCLALC